jgi:hypothetical protein
MRRVMQRWRMGRRGRPGLRRGNRIVSCMLEDPGEMKACCYRCSQLVPGQKVYRNDSLDLVQVLDGKVSFKLHGKGVYLP